MPSQPGTFVLHHYQNTVVTDICRRSHDVLVEQPTGSGKTVEIVAIIARLLGSAYSHAVIAAPQEQIEASFVHRSYQRIVADKKVLAAGPEKIRAAREGTSSLRNLASISRPRNRALPWPAPTRHWPSSNRTSCRQTCAAACWSSTRPTMSRPPASALSFGSSSNAAPASSTSRPPPSARTGCPYNCRACT